MSRSEFVLGFAVFGFGSEIDYGFQLDFVEQDFPVMVGCGIWSCAAVQEAGSEDVPASGVVDEGSYVAEIDYVVECVAA